MGLRTVLGRCTTNFIIILGRSIKCLISGWDFDSRVGKRDNSQAKRCCVIVLQIGICITYLSVVCPPNLITAQETYKHLVVSSDLPLGTWQRLWKF
jgi:hypothetical protein